MNQLHLPWIPLFLAVAAAAAVADPVTQAPAAPPAQGVFDVRHYGAAGDGQTLDTKSIQAAIDACAAAGGGTVSLACGTFLSGTIQLRDNVTLFLQAGAVLLASTRQEDFPERALVYAENARNIAVLGRGAIDGNGAVSTEFPKVRSHPIYFVECDNVQVKDVTLRDSTTWLQHYFKCDNLTIDGVTVDSRINPEIERPRHLPGAPGRNEDGMNLNSCRNVRVANCNIFSDDDGIVLKSTSERPCRNVTISNCVVSSNASAIKFGTESGGGFQNVVINNCAVYDTRNAGLALEIVDGGVLDRVAISNIVMDNIKGAAIFIRLGARGRPYKTEHPTIGRLQNVMIANVQATRVGGWIEPVGKRVVGCSITGLPGHEVENLTLENIRIQFKGGGAPEDAARQIAERPEAYPSCRMFGTLPAYGFFIRHAKNIALRNVDLRFEHEERRPAVICDDVNGLELAGFDAESVPDATLPLVWLKNSRGAWVHGCRITRKTQTFLRVDGDQSAGVCLMNNDFSRVRRVIDLGDDAAADAVYAANNRTR